MASAMTSQWERFFGDESIESLEEIIQVCRRLLEEKRRAPPETKDTPDKEQARDKTANQDKNEEAAESADHENNEETGDYEDDYEAEEPGDEDAWQEDEAGGEDAGEDELQDGDHGDGEHGEGEEEEEGGIGEDFFDDHDDKDGKGGNSNIYVRGFHIMPFKAFEQLFEPFGPVVSHNVFKGYGFAKLSSPEAASKAVEKLNGSMYEGSHLTVRLADKDIDVNARRIRRTKGKGKGKDKGKKDGKAMGKDKGKDRGKDKGKSGGKERGKGRSRDKGKGMSKDKGKFSGKDKGKANGKDSAAGPSRKRPREDSSFSKGSSNGYHREDDRDRWDRHDGKGRDRWERQDRNDSYGKSGHGKGHNGKSSAGKDSRWHAPMPSSSADSGKTPWKPKPIPRSSAQPIGAASTTSTLPPRPSQAKPSTA